MRRRADQHVSALRTINVVDGKRTTDRSREIQDLFIELPPSAEWRDADGYYCRLCAAYLRKKPAWLLYKDREADGARDHQEVILSFGRGAELMTVFGHWGFPRRNQLFDGFYVPYRPNFDDRVEACELDKGSRVGVQSIYNGSICRRAATVAIINYEAQTIAFEDWGGGTEYCFSDLGLAANEEGEWHKSHYCYRPE